jgi:hypothetical protein
MFRTVSRLACLAVAATPALGGTVSLSFNPLDQTVDKGDIVEIQIIAISDDGDPQPFAAMDAIIDWDPVYLELLGVDDSDSPYAWFISDFLPDPDGINDDLTDGEVLYTALAQPGNPAMAPGDPGMVVTTLQFRAIERNELGTTVRYIPAVGAFGRTRVLYEPGDDITGDISDEAMVIIEHACPNPGCTADLNFDCRIDLADLGILLASYNLDGGGDVDDDGDTDLADLGLLLSEYGNDCNDP